MTGGKRFGSDTRWPLLLRFDACQPANKNKDKTLIRVWAQNPTCTSGEPAKCAELGVAARNTFDLLPPQRQWQALLEHNKHRRCRWDRPRARQGHAQLTVIQRHVLVAGRQVPLADHGVGRLLDQPFVEALGPWLCPNTRAHTQAHITAHPRNAPV